jgi:Kef-type K+ transport system membrane component KefB
MNNTHGTWVMLVGALIVLASFARVLATRLGLPSVVGLLALGLIVGLLNAHFELLAPPAREALALLADLGIVALLFKVGLDSKLGGLLAQLPRAVLVWFGNVTISAALGFAAAHQILGLSLANSLVIAVALSATSIGIAVTVWDEARRLNSTEGRLTLDVAELDDVSAVILLAVLLAALPVLLAGDGIAWSAALAAGAVVLLKLAAFGAFCVLFAVFIEPRVTALAKRLSPTPARMLTVAGVGFMIAAAAEWLGFSLAVGALFAGLVFSRDPAAVRVEARFDDLHALLVPFFFIGVGMQLEFFVLQEALVPAVVLCAVAIAGKLVGGGLPALAFTGTWGALAVGMSLVPRAEIALYVAHQARSGGDAVLTAPAYAALVAVVLVTSIVGPLLLRPVLRRRWPTRGGHR